MSVPAQWPRRARRFVRFAARAAAGGGRRGRHCDGRIGGAPNQRALLAQRWHAQHELAARARLAPRRIVCHFACTRMTSPGCRPRDARSSVAFPFHVRPALSTMRCTASAPARPPGNAMAVKHDLRQPMIVGSLHCKHDLVSGPDNRVVRRGENLDGRCGVGDDLELECGWHIGDWPGRPCRTPVPSPFGPRLGYQSPRKAPRPQDEVTNPCRSRPRCPPRTSAMPASSVDALPVNSMRVPLGTRRVFARGKDLLRPMQICRVVALNATLQRMVGRPREP